MRYNSNQKTLAADILSAVFFYSQVLQSLENCGRLFLHFSVLDLQWRRYNQKKDEYDKDYYYSKFIKISAAVKKIIDEFEQYANGDTVFKMKLERMIIDSFIKYVCG